MCLSVVECWGRPDVGLSLISSLGRLPDDSQKPEYGLEAVKSSAGQCSGRFELQVPDIFFARV